MISLLDVNTYASMVKDYLAEESKSKCAELVPAIESKLADRREVLNNLQAKAELLESDNAWNRYESADEAYGYGEQLKELLDNFVNDLEEWEDVEWQIDDIISSTRKEFNYRLERAQW